MTTKSFRAKLQRPEGSGTWTFVMVPFDVESMYGRRGRIPVRATIDGHAIQSSLMPHGDGRHFIVVKKELRERIGKDAGAVVNVELRQDTRPRVVTLPDDFVSAMNGSPNVKTLFDGLSYSYRKEYVQWIEGAKRSETRERRIHQAVEMIASGKRAKGS